eukprot:TRINITY_DN5659_c0_g1_i1.p1 TRINITY_DN5659_c0_g1~~TRINITY_DN5659_c0_g1_i1.p1  ORF type:complete len:219 (+),score=48.52 TRINITY_DN5659_c0_g1_i1:2-658(+)
MEASAQPARPQTVREELSKNKSDFNWVFHLYRAEMQVLVAYRKRLDTSSNWAVTFVSVLGTYALRSEQIPHYFFIFLAVMLFAFLNIEARRYQSFAKIHRRTRCFELGIFQDLWLEAEQTRAETAPEYFQQLIKEYHFTSVDQAVPYLVAVQRRMQHLYIYMFWLVFVMWIFKLQEVATSEAVTLSHFSTELGCATAIMVAGSIIVWMFYQQPQDLPV